MTIHNTNSKNSIETNNILVSQDSKSTQPETFEDLSLNLNEKQTKRQGRGFKSNSVSSKMVRGKDRKPRKSGSNHGLYKHGKGKNRDYDSIKYSAWMAGVYQKDGFKCFISGETSNLSAHHLESVDKNPDKVYEITNGLTLTKPIHDQFHNLFGRGNNTREQFERFAREQYGVNEFPWQNGNHDPSFTLQDILERQKTQKEQKTDELFKLMQDRNHKLISTGDDFTADAFIEVYCNIHKLSHPTKVRNYRRSVTGLPCCGRQNQSNKGSWDIVNQMKKTRRQSNS
jgi:hypothetical protein